jgi:hypothetical protein
MQIAQRAIRPKYYLFLYMTKAYDGGKNMPELRTSRYWIIRGQAANQLRSAMSDIRKID